MVVIVTVTVVVTMAVGEVLVVIASNVASLVTLPGSVHLVMVVEGIGTVVVGMIGTVVAVVAVMDLIEMGTDMVVGEAGIVEAVVEEEAINTVVIALDHMNAPVVVVEATVDGFCRP